MKAVALQHRKLRFKTRKPLCLCSNVINSFDGFDSLSVFCNFLPYSGPRFPHGLSSIEQSVKDTGEETSGAASPSAEVFPLQLYYCP